MKRIYKDATFIVPLVPHGYEDSDHSLKWTQSLHELYSLVSRRGSVNAWNDQSKGLVEVRITDPTLTRDLRSHKYPLVIAGTPTLKTEEMSPKV